MTRIDRDHFGDAEAGSVERFTLENNLGSRVRIIALGATITELHLADRKGMLTDVVLGFDAVKDYETNEPYMGCTVGRVANRIANACFTLEGTQYQLARNLDPHHLHGGEVVYSLTNANGLKTTTKRAPTRRRPLTSPITLTSTWPDPEPGPSSITKSKFTQTMSPSANQMAYLPVRSSGLKERPRISGHPGGWAQGLPSSGAVTTTTTSSQAAVERVPCWLRKRLILPAGAKWRCGRRNRACSCIPDPF